MKLEEITSGASLEGVEPSSVVTVVAAIAIPPGSLQLVYRLPDGGLRERLLTRADEASLREATVTRPWSFAGDGAAFQLTAEAKRIDFAFLFDPMMAVHTSVVQPLPHQITAVYESMLPRQPLRFVLADDPGAGKTIMAGLYIQELIMASMIHPGHPLMMAVTDLILEQHENLLRQGAVLVDPADEGDEPHLLFLLTHEIKSGHGQVTRNEMLYALNQAEKFRLAFVLVGEGDAVEGPYYLKNPFQTEPGWGVPSVNFDIKALVERAERV